MAQATILWRKTESLKPCIRTMHLSSLPEKKLKDKNVVGGRWLVFRVELVAPFA